MYDLIVDEVFIASYAKLEEVVQQLKDYAESPLLPIVSVKIDYRE